MLQRQSRRYTADDSGHIAVLFALMALPLLICISAAMDYSYAVSQNNQMEHALDAAVIAAMSNNSLNSDEKEDYAEAYFNDNYFGTLPVELKAMATADRVELHGVVKAELTLGKAVGLPQLTLSSQSAAEIASENTICVLALSKDMRYAVSFEGDLEFAAPTCSVYSNSTHKWALSSAVRSSLPKAKSFCSAGGVDGDFSPAAKGECKEIEDPYVNVIAPRMGNCPTNTGVVGEGDYSPQSLLSTTQTLNRGGAIIGNLTGSNAIMFPGTYCGGLTVDGRNVTFMPGDYIMRDGPLVFTNAAEANAENVTFSFIGDGATLEVDNGAQAFIKAPLTGPRKGLAFMELKDSSLPGSRRLPDGGVEITKGGLLEVNGTLYFPSKEILVRGEGTSVGATAPATSFIGHNIRFMGVKGTKVEIKVDHLKAGLPPILPRAEDGVRLAK